MQLVPSLVQKQVSITHFLRVSKLYFYKTDIWVW